MPSHLQLAPEVAAALAAGGPVVALESTIISHGMSWPRNLETARRVEAIIRDKGAVPATIAVLDGRIRVGLGDAELERLATQAGLAKVKLRGCARVEARFTFARGRWYAVETEIKLNTPGQSDGLLRIWIDGKLIAEKTQMNITGSVASPINRVMFGGWYSSSAAGRNPCRYVFDDRIDVGEGDSLALTATVAGEVDSEVIWSIEPRGVGSISQEGRYTAPKPFQPELSTVTVIATSKKDAKRIAKKVLTITAQDGPAINPIR